MFAYNRHTGQVERLGQAVKGANGQAVPGPFSGPVVDHDHVIWSQVIGPATSQQDTSKDVVRLEDLTTGQVTTLASGAVYANLSWPWAVWAQEGANSAGWIEFRNLLTGKTTRLDDKPSYLALAGTSVAYIDNNSTLYQIDDVTQGTSNPQMLWSAPPNEYLDFVTMNDRLIGWNQNSAAMVYDRQLRRFVTLPLVYSQISASIVIGRTLIWGDGVPASQQQQESQICHGEQAGILNVVDTSALPTSIASGG